jgi:hypothetical protein
MASLVSKAVHLKIFKMLCLAMAAERCGLAQEAAALFVKAGKLLPKGVYVKSYSPEHVDFFVAEAQFS